MNFKHTFGTLLEWFGGSTMLVTLVQGFQAFWFACGGVAFLVGAIIKYLEYKDKKLERKD